MVLEEAVAEVAPQGLTAGLVLLGREVFGQEGEVVFKVSLIPGHRDELHEAMGGIIFKPIGVGEWNDAVWVGRERGVAAGVEAGTSAVGVDEARRVQTVAAHHAADGVRDQLLHGVRPEAIPLFLFGEITAIAIGRIRRESDLLDGDVGGEFALAIHKRR